MKLFRNMNQDEIPWEKTDPGYSAFWENEKEKVKNGIEIDGYKFSGWLYWHINHWKLTTDDLTNPDDINADINTITPDLRDNELILNDALVEAETKRKGLVIMGLRQMGKTSMEASYGGRSGIIFKNSQNLIMGTNSDDLNNITQNIDFGLLNCTPYFRIPRISRDWNSERVLLGVKTKSGDNIIHSTYVIRNTGGGKKTEKGAGVSNLKCNLWDEALEENSLIYYNGYEKRIKDVKIGDEIYGDDGKLTKVLDKVNPGVVDIYEIEFSNGKRIKCSGNHLWTVYNTHLEKWLDLTTDEINKKYYYLKKDNRYNKHIKSLIYSIPVSKPIQYQQKDLKIDPYLLGLWLGDGNSNSVTICSIDDEIINYLVDHSKKIGVMNTIEPDPSKGNGNFRYCRIHNGWKNDNQIRSSFKDYDLFNNKHIPTDYLYSSVDQRLELLKGLMDTDGSCDKSGNIEFGTSIPKLYEGMKFLLGSLGISYKVEKVRKTYNYKKEKKIGKEHFRFKIYTDLKIFKLNRKLNNYNISDSKKMKSYKERVTIKNITKVEKAQAYCLKVDNKSKLFLAGDFIVTHNCGKDDFLSALVATKPAMLGANGWRTIPICTGTGGNILKAQDAKKLFMNPGVHEFLEFEQENGLKTGLFMPGWLRQDCKYETVLSKYLISTGRVKDIPDNSELHLIKIKVADKDLAIQKIENELDVLLAAGDTTELNRWKAYYPLKIDDIFLTESNNRFNREAIEQQQAWLADHFEPVYADFYRDMNGKVQWKYSEYRPISKFPVKPNELKYTPVCIYEHPIANAPKFTYCIGIDPVNNNDSTDKVVSLFTIKVFKRMISPLDEYKNQIVASYRGRPKELAEAHELTLLLAEYYNAIEGVLPEASENSIFQYFFMKRKGHYLANSFDMVSEISKGKSSFKGKKGLPATTTNQRHYMHLMVEYAKDELITLDDDGEETMSYGVTKIKDPMLLEEMKMYRSKAPGSKGVHDGNYDSIVSFGCALTLASYYDIKYPLASQIPTKPADNQQVRRASLKTPFGIIERKNNKLSFEGSNKVNLPRWMR